MRSCVSVQSQTKKAEETRAETLLPLVGEKLGFTERSLGLFVACMDPDRSKLSPASNAMSAVYKKGSLPTSMCDNFKILAAECAKPGLKTADLLQSEYKEELQKTIEPFIANETKYTKAFVVWKLQGEFQMRFGVQNTDWAVRLETLTNAAASASRIQHSVTNSKSRGQERKIASGHGSATLSSRQVSFQGSGAHVSGSELGRAA
jgi:hypothetical protein